MKSRYIAQEKRIIASMRKRIEYIKKDAEENIKRCEKIIQEAENNIKNI